MDSKRLQKLIRECITEVLSEEIVRVCAYCDIISPTPDNPEKSHGMCKEHFIAHMVAEGFPYDAIAAKANAKDPSKFSPNTSGAKATDPLPNRSVAQ